MDRRMFIGTAGATLLFPLASMASESTIEHLLKLTKNVLTILRDNEEYQYADVAEYVDQIFDRERIAKVVAGRKEWRAADEETRHAFKEVLSEYLFHSYINNLKNYGIDRALKLLDEIKYTEVIKGQWVFYKFVLFVPAPLKINVRTKNEKVVDVEAENISLVLTIRDEFRGQIRKYGLDGVTELMEV